MPNAKSFTLAEMMITVVIIGILALFAVPEYLKATERARGAKAKHNILLIVQAQMIYRNKYDQYRDVSGNQAVADAFSSFLDFSPLVDDTDWAYTTYQCHGTLKSVCVEGQRQTGKYTGSIFTYQSAPEGGMDAGWYNCQNTRLSNCTGGKWPPAG